MLKLGDKGFTSSPSKGVATKSVITPWIGLKDKEKLATMAKFAMVVPKAARKNSQNMEGHNARWAVNSGHVDAEKIESKATLLTL